MVKLEGIYGCLSHNDVTTAVEQFGKTKSVVLFRSRQQVCRESREEARIVYKVSVIHSSENWKANGKTSSITDFQCVKSVSRRSWLCNVKICAFVCFVYVCDV